MFLIKICLCEEILKSSQPNQEENSFFEKLFSLVSKDRHTLRFESDDNGLPSKFENVQFFVWLSLFV